MILNKHGDFFYHEGVKYVVGEEIVSTDKSDYKNLIGYITEIRVGEDKETDNETPDIYCRFEVPASPYDVKEMEKLFSELYGTPKPITDISLDMVIMAPDMIIPTRVFKNEAHPLTVYTVQEDWSVNGESGYSTGVYLDYLAAKLHFHNSLVEELIQGAIPDWAEQANFVCESSADSYEAYLNGEYMENHYKLTISLHSVSLPASLAGAIGRSYIEECRVEDFIEQIAEWDEVDAMSKGQYKKLIADPSIPDRIEKKLGMNDAYWEAYWESISEVAHEMVRKYAKEDQK